MASGEGSGNATGMRTVAVLAAGAFALGAVAFVALRDDAPSGSDAALVAEIGPETAEPAEAPSEGENPPAAEDTQADQTVPDDEAATDTPATPEPPRFDQIRVAPDGATVVAGRAPSGAEVSLRLDGSEVASTRSGGSGNFAAILTLPPSQSPRIMGLLAVLPDGSEVPGTETVIIAPFGVPASEAVALAETAPDTRPAGETDGVVATPVQTAEATSEEPGGLGPASAEGDPAAESPAGDARPGAVAEADATPEESAAPEDEPAPIDLAAANPPPDAPAPADPLQQGDSATAEQAGGGDPAAADDGGRDAPDARPVPREAPAPSDDVVAADAPDDDGAPVADASDAETAEAPSGDATAPGDVAAAPAEDAAAATPEVQVAGAAPEPAVEAPPREPQAPSVIVAGPEGVRVLQGAAPEAQTDIRIDAITYSTEGDVTLSGSGMADRQVQVLLNNRPIELGEIGPGGQWSLELPDVDPGTYTLSVAQLTPEGEVESRVDTPFLREDPARIVANPMLVDAGVSVITVQPGFTLWGIAEANFGQGVAYVQIFRENRDRIRDPDWIFPGQIFRLPDLPRTTGQE